MQEIFENRLWWPDDGVWKRSSCVQTPSSRAAQRRYIDLCVSGLSNATGPLILPPRTTGV
jgi:hypothetical protein